MLARWLDRFAGRDVSSRAIRRPGRSQGDRRRLLMLEPLEGRRLLSITSVVESPGVLRVRSDASDAIVIGDVGGSVTINGVNPDTGAYSAANLTAVEIAGGAGANDIDLRAVVPSLFPSLTRVQVDGGGGGDRLSGPDLTLTWLVTADDTGSLTGPDLGSLTSFDFASIANLVGAAAADTFVFADGAHLSGSIDGGGGRDTLDFGDVGADLAIALAGSDATGFLGTAGGPVGSFRGIDALIGGPGTDTLAGEDLASTWSLDSAPTYNDGAGTLGFSGFEHLRGGSGDDVFHLIGDTLGNLRADIEGGPGDDQFNFIGDAILTGSIDGQGGRDTLSYADFGSTVSIVLTGSTDLGFSGTEGSTFSGGAFHGIDILTGSAPGNGPDTLTGEDVPSIWTLDTTRTYSPGAGKTLAFSSFETMQGGSADDRFDLRAGAATDLGGGAGDDTLNFDARNQVVTQTPTSITAGTFAAVTYNDIETINIFNQANATPASADLVLGQSHSPEPVGIGQSVSYTLTITNIGPSAATGVVVTDRLPTGLTSVSASSTQGDCNVAGGLVTCHLGTISDGATVTIKIVATPQEAGTYTNTASVQGNEVDPIPLNNSSAQPSTVVGRPRANAQSVTTAQGTSQPITLTGSDPNTPPLTLTYTVTVSPAHGSLSGTAPNLIYTPAAGYTGADSFQFTDSNGVTTGAPATVAITVTVTAPSSTSPVAKDDGFTTAEGTSLKIAAPGVLANDIAAVGAALTAILVTGPARGTLVLNSNGSFLYSPVAGFSGSDIFTYQASDATNLSNVATVSLTVTPAVPDNKNPRGQGQPPTLAFPGVLILPNTPYFNYLRMRRSIDSDRFDSYHPRIGALLGLEITGIPTSPIRLLHPNHHFNTAALRSFYGRDPRRFEVQHPVLGALFQLESPGDEALTTQLLPATPRFNSIRARHERDPKRFSRHCPYYGALMALEDIERSSHPNV
jgi:uncharacterized repeat protein (TIGR01451 family)